MIDPSTQQPTVRPYQALHPTPPPVLSPEELRQQQANAVSPFWNYQGPPLKPGNPLAERATVETQNQFIRQLYGNLPQTQNPYGDSPGAGYLHQTLMALLGMAGRGSPGTYGRSSQSLFGSDVQRMAPSAGRGLVLQEPDRLKQLMTLLLGSYVLSGKIPAEQLSEQAKLQQLKAAHRQAVQQQYGQIPIVGPLIAGIKG